MEPPINPDRPYSIETTNATETFHRHPKVHLLKDPTGHTLTTTSGGDGKLAYQEQKLCNDAYEAGIAEGIRRAAAVQSWKKAAAQ